MKRYDDSIHFNHKRHLEIKQEYMARIIVESGLLKGDSMKSKMTICHFIGSLVGNLIDALLLQRNVAIRISDIDPTPTVKNKILNCFQKLNLILWVEKGYSFKETKDANIPAHDLTKIAPSYKILDVFDPTRISISKAWGIVVRANNTEIKQ